WHVRSSRYKSIRRRCRGQGRIEEKRRRIVAESWRRSRGAHSAPYISGRRFAVRRYHAAMTPDSFDVTALASFLDGEQRAVRERVRRLLSSPDFAYCSALDRETYRSQVLAWCRKLAAEGLGALALPRQHGGSDDPAAFVAAFETLAHHD